MLRDFGLTRKQASVYLTRARLKPVTPIDQISKESRVAREDVYRVISELERIGLIEKIPDVPAKIKSRSLMKGCSCSLHDRKKPLKEKYPFCLQKEIKS
jgi:sugar-specific transcriptional regulator TrmB